MSKSRIKGVTARSLHANSDRRIIDEIISDQIKTIDMCIQTTHSAGFNMIRHELPVNFQINNLSKKDAQIMIYSEILLIYSKEECDGGKGFTKVNIEIDPAPVLVIEWLNGMDEDERSQREKIIKSFLKRKTT